MTGHLAGALAGRRVVNTRAAHQAAALDGLLEAQGAIPIAYPCIRIVPPADTAPLDAGLRKLAGGGFDWLLLTSANTVDAVANRCAALGLAMPPVRVAAVGTATAEAAAAVGLRASLVPEEAVAESLAGALEIGPGTRIFLPESALARPTLADRLRGRGAAVTAAPAYETLRGSGGADLPRLLAAERIDAIAFTSSSTVTFFFERLRTEGGAAGGAPALVRGVCLACIGPKTAATVRAHGLDVAVQPSTYALPALVEALAAWFGSQPGPLSRIDDPSLLGYGS